jgi:hypothetical protein
MTILTSVLRAGMTMLLLLHVIEAAASSPEQPYLCNLGQVHLADSRAFARVRSGPGRSFRVVEALSNKATVYICDETEFWFKAFYATKTGPCAEVNPHGLGSDVVKSCRNGWIDKRLVTVLSG